MTQCEHLCLTGMCAALPLERSKRRGGVRENTCGELPSTGPQDRKLHPILSLQTKHDGARIQVHALQ